MWEGAVLGTGGAWEEMSWTNVCRVKNAMKLGICWSAANGGLRDGGLRKSEDIRGKRPFSSVFWIFQVLFAPSGKGQKRQKKGEKGRFRAISRKGGQAPLKPPFVTPPFAADQICSRKTSREKWREICREKFWALWSFVSWGKRSSRIAPEISGHFPWQLPRTVSGENSLQHFCTPSRDEKCQFHRGGSEPRAYRKRTPLSEDCQVQSKRDAPKWPFWKNHASSMPMVEAPLQQKNLHTTSDRNPWVRENVSTGFLEFSPVDFFPFSPGFLCVS